MFKIVIINLASDEAWNSPIIVVGALGTGTNRGGKHKALCWLSLFCDIALFINDFKPDSIKKGLFSY